MTSEVKWIFHAHQIASQFRVMQEGSFENLDLDFCLICKLLLRFNDLQSNVLLFLVVECLEDLSERSSAQILNNFVFVCNGVSDYNFGFSFWVGKVRRIINSPVANKEDLKVGHFLLFKGRKFLFTIWAFVRWGFFNLRRFIFLRGLQNGYFSLSVLELVAHPDDVFIGILSKSFIFWQYFPKRWFIIIWYVVIFEEALMIFV